MDWFESDYSQQTAFRFARSGALVRIATAEDACEVCEAMARRTYTPSEVPRLPIRGCLHEPCRCHFEAVDPETELTVSQLVQRGAQALKAGRTDIARQILRRAVTLDEMYERGWLWLSGVVDDREKITCLEKVLAINPGNQRARKGLRSLREKLGSLPEPEPVSARPAPAKVEEQRPPESVPEEPPEEPPIPEVPVEELPAEPKPLPIGVIEVREEREVIVEQWGEFLDIAVETDPGMLLMQGQAFLKKLGGLNEQALEMLSPAVRLEELQLQWRESEVIGEAMADALDVHESQRSDAPDWQAMHESMRHLAQQLLDHRNALRAQIAAAGGQVSTKRSL